MAHFPIFVNLQDKLVVVVGAGRIASRRIKTLLDFGCHIRVIAPKVDYRIQELADTDKIILIQDEYQSKYLAQAFLVLAATDKREINHQIAMETTRLNIPVSVADCKQQSTFFFPAIFQDENIIGGLISRQGHDHHLVKDQAEQIRNFLSRGK